MVPLALSGKASYAALLGLGAFFGFLLFLTVLLREHTESRLVPGRTVSTKVCGVFLSLVGAGGIGLSVRLIDGYRPTGRRSGLLRLSIEYLGPWPAAAFFLAFGACMLGLAYRLFRSR
ncbi:hypothetical protein Mpe_B0639 (plasmid) [Methylibium petroleiphilum PM1]|uniref:Transmembrane protein n=2 Tax=Methylibium TaxID=316612 RepID=A2SPB4_METPP|nr:hypothetical protein Mpe_B0639 [Methylibium petroleiphilum PM1]